MSAANSNIPLCVDLDGTLVQTDLLHEGVLQFAKTSPMSLANVPAWLLKGKAAFKHSIGSRAQLDVETLPYRRSVLEIIDQARSEGRRIVLATAATKSVADEVAKHLGVFDEVLSSNDRLNLSCLNKLAALEERFGAFGFDYVGDSRDDIPILLKARKGYLVGSLAGGAMKSERMHSLEIPSTRFGVWLRALRAHQWLKNLLVFIPAAASHRIFDLHIFYSSLIAFLAFSLCASSVYILNDLIDLQSDRRHPKKRHRPFASGLLPIRSGLIAAILLLTSAALLSLALRPQFLLVVGFYYLLTSAYSFFLKRQVIVDVMLLAALYTLRIIAGSAATAIAPSFWLLAFSMFIFLCLAMVKRYSDLRMAQGGADAIGGRGYTPADLQVVLALGVSSGMVSAMILALYTQAQAVSMQYSAPEYLWFLPLLVLYWVARIWMKAQRGEVHHDPVVFAAQDWQSLTILGLAVACLAAAKLNLPSLSLWN
jgi:4-hydroxybenzoate polyprenyltransferase/phosphoserine phosphatase